MLRVLEIVARPLPETPRGVLRGTCASAQQTPVRCIRCMTDQGRGGDGGCAVGEPGGFWRCGMSLDGMQWAFLAKCEIGIQIAYLLLFFNSKYLLVRRTETRLRLTSVFRRYIRISQLAYRSRQNIE